MSQAVLPKPLSSRQLRDEHDDIVLKSLIGPVTVWMSDKQKKTARRVWCRAGGLGECTNLSRGTLSFTDPG